jgi:hypothetical protein
MESPDKNK